MFRFVLAGLAHRGTKVDPVGRLPAARSLRVHYLGDPDALEQEAQARIDLAQALQPLR